MIENNKPQTLPEYWELFEKYIHDFLDKKRKSLSKENKEKIFKHARALFNGKAELKGKKLMDGLKITLNLNLSEIHAIAGDFRNLHGDPGNGYTLNQIATGCETNYVLLGGGCYGCTATKDAYQIATCSC